MANTDGKIYITITDHPVGGQSPNTPQPPQVSGQANKTQEQQKSDILGDYAKHKTFDFIRQQAKAQVNYTISNIGNFTGDFQSQRDVQFMTNSLNYVSGISMTAIAGFKYGGSVGAVIGATIGLASSGINYARQERTGRIMNAQTNRELSILREISGLDPLTNGGRI